MYHVIDRVFAFSGLSNLQEKYVEGQRGGGSGSFGAKQRSGQKRTFLLYTGQQDIIVYKRERPKNTGATVSLTERRRPFIEPGTVAEIRWYYMQKLEMTYRA